ncbi:MAG: hypothetical protein KBA64_06135 [Armatimonadetes bacterium]|jgi:hypothetical protein|nr:hypothetical protein [Armatimonadota bacterium]
MRRHPRYVVRHPSCVALAFLTLATCRIAPAQSSIDPDDIVPVNLVSAEVEQLHNAVRVVLEADGTLTSALPYHYYDILESRVTDDISTRTIDEVPFQLTNARSRIGSFVDVSSYPVSHIVITPMGTGNRGIGLECNLVLYRPGGVVDSDMMSYLWRLGAGAYEWRSMGVSILIDVRLSQDERSVIITVNSDQYRDASAERVYHQPGPDDLQRLAIGQRDGLFAVDAVNVPLARLVEELGRLCGRPISLSAERERWVTAYIPSATVDEILEAICAGYELSSSELSGGGVLISEARPVDAQSYAGNRSVAVPCHHITAKDAVNLLPYSLLPYLRLDMDNNAIIVTGSRALADKVRADVATFDIPPPLVQIEARVVALSGTDKTAFMSDGWGTSADDSVLTGRPGAVGYASGAGVGEAEDALFPGMVMFPRVTPAGGWHAALAALESEGRSRTIARPHLTVANGRRADLFVGDRKFIEALPSRRSLGGLREIGSGIRLTVTPQAGSEGDITLHLNLSVSSFVEIADGLNVPSSATRAMSGTVRVRQGDSVIIGGLMQEIESDAALGLPGVVDVAALRRLLGADSESTGYDDVIYILTARVVDNGPQTTESFVLLGGDQSEAVTPRDDRPSVAEFVRSVRTWRSVGEHQDG